MGSSASVSEIQAKVGLSPRFSGSQTTSSDVRSRPAYPRQQKSPTVNCPVVQREEVVVQVANTSGPVTRDKSGVQQLNQVQPEQDTIQDRASSVSGKEQSKRGSHCVSREAYYSVTSTAKDMANRQWMPQSTGMFPPISNHPELTRQPVQYPSYSYPVQTGSRPEPGDGTSGRPSSAGLGYWDTTRDMILTRIMSADEFLGRMAETDERIRSWSACGEAEMKVVRLKELLGLRGHLQDELLRIEAMLAEDDPELRILDDFQAHFPHVVGKLRELNTMAQRIQIQSTDIGIDPDTVASSSTATQVTPRRHGQSIGIQISGSGQGIGVLNTTSDGNSNTEGSDGEEIHEELRRKFVAEEEHIAGDFAERFAHQGHRLEEEDFNQLLNEHALAMQALRMKQNIEKTRYKERLVAKKKERLQRRRPGNEAMAKVKKSEAFFVDVSDSMSSSRKLTGAGSPVKKWFSVDINGTVTEGGSGESTKKADGTEKLQRQGTFTKETDHTLQRQGTFSLDTNTPLVPNEDCTKTNSPANDKGDGVPSEQESEESESDQDDNYEDDFEEDDESNDEGSEELKTTLKKDLWSTIEKDGAEQEALEDILRRFHDEEENRKSLRSMEKQRYESLRDAKLAQKKKKNDSSSNEIETQTDSFSVTSIGTETANLLEKEFKAVREKDKELLDVLLKKRKSLSDADFNQLLKKHLADMESLREQRAHEQKLLKDKLKEKLQHRKKNNGKGDDNESSPDEESIEAEVIEKTSAVDEKLHRELTELDEKLVKELRHQGKNIDESDLAELLAHYRHKQELLLKRRQQEKDEVNKKLRQKLREKKAKKDAQRKKTDLDVEGKDDSFFQELEKLHSKGQLTEAAFSTMLQDHLARMDRNKRNEKKREREQKRKELDRSAASSLVHEHQEQTEQIKGIRQREKNIMDERLKKKLMAKKAKGK